MTDEVDPLRKKIKAEDNSTNVKVNLLGFPVQPSEIGECLIEFGKQQKMKTMFYFRLSMQFFYVLCCVFVSCGSFFF